MWGGVVAGSCCGVWSADMCSVEGGEGVRCATRFFDRADGLKKPHLGQTYSVQMIVNKHHNAGVKRLTRILPHVFFHETVVSETFLTNECIA